MTQKMSLSTVTTGDALDPKKLVDEFNRLMSTIFVGKDLTRYKLVEIPVVVQAALDDPYPILVRLDWRPSVVLVAKASNRVAGSDPIYAGAVVDWENRADGITIRYISGLSANSKYDITLLVMGDGR